MTDVQVGDLVKYAEDGISWITHLAEDDPDERQAMTVVERAKMVGVIVGKSWSVPPFNGDGREIYKVEVVWLVSGTPSVKRAEYLDDLEIVSRGRPSEKR